MQTFWLSLFMIFIAELGDKTQLVALTLATRYNARVVLAGVFVATLVVHVFSSLLGNVLGVILPGDWVQYIAGLAFVVFGLWTLRGDSLEENRRQVRFVCPFWVVSVTFFMAELGDKTMLSTVTLATTGGMVAVWLGSTLGMVVSDGLAIWLGRVLGTRLPERQVSIFAALIFFSYGLYSIVRGGSALPVWTWAAGSLCLVCATYVLLIRRGAVELDSAESDLPVPGVGPQSGLRRFCDYCVLRSPCCEPDQR